MSGETNLAPGQYMRGSCFALALYLYDRTDLSLYGLFDDDGHLHHAFVADAATGVGYDGRGRTSLSTVTRFRGDECRGRIVRPTAREIVAQSADKARGCRVNPCDPSASEIRRFVMRGRFPPIARKSVRPKVIAPTGTGISDRGSTP